MCLRMAPHLVLRSGAPSILQRLHSARTCSSGTCVQCSRGRGAPRIERLTKPAPAVQFKVIQDCICAERSVQVLRYPVGVNAWVHPHATPKKQCLLTTRMPPLDGSAGPSSTPPHRGFHVLPSGSGALWSKRIVSGWHTAVLLTENTSAVQNRVANNWLGIEASAFQPPDLQKYGLEREKVRTLVSSIFVRIPPF